MREDERRRRAEETDDSDLFGPSRSSTGLGKAIAGMTRHRARIREYPRKVIDEFREDSKIELNVRHGESWAFPDLAKRNRGDTFRGSNDATSSLRTFSSCSSKDSPCKLRP